MLVHICCSVDSHFFLQKLQEAYPHERLIGFFYDPNIHPYSEYQLRLLDVKRSCDKLGIPLVEGDYNVEGWLDAVRGLEFEPEKGKRCQVCFDNRLEESAKKASELGEKTLTTTLLTSPKKSLAQLEKALLEIAQVHGLSIVAPDFRKGGGTQEQFALAKRDMLYHQDYCGCLFALKAQRDQQKRWLDELCSPLSQQILPSSIEERLALYQRVIEAEAEQRSFRLVREKFLNYRLLYASITCNEKVIPSYPLFYSTMKKERVKTGVDFIHEGVAYLKKEEIRLVSLSCFNTLAHTSYQTVKELMKSPLSVHEEIAVRQKLISSMSYSLTPLIVVDALSDGAYEIFLQTQTYSDIRENLVFIR